MSNPKTECSDGTTGDGGKVPSHQSTGAAASHCLVVVIVVAVAAALYVVHSNGRSSPMVKAGGSKIDPGKPRGFKEDKRRVRVNAV